LGKPVEFGYKAQATDNADGVVLDYLVEVANPAAAPLLVPAVERIIQQTGRVPGAATADRGYGEAVVDDDLHALGVDRWRSPQGHAQQHPPSPRAHPAVSAAGQVAHRL
jgi:transposase, IS5 family